MTSPPRVLDTARLRLRAPAPSDVPDIFAYAADPEVTRFMDWARLTREVEVGDFLRSAAASWEDGSEYTWVITERGVDRVIGAASIRPRRRDADFGYVIHRPFWSRGFATEAATALVAWAKAEGLPRIWATCDVENRRSARVLEKLGLGCEGLVPGGALRPNLSGLPRDTLRYATPCITRRAASRDDAEFALRVERETMRDYTIAAFGNWAEEAVRERSFGHVERGRTAVVEADGVPIGVLRVERGADGIDLKQLFILPSHQRRGIGEALTRDLMRESQVGGVPLKLRVLKVNPARRFYERLGFSAVGEGREHVYLRYLHEEARVRAGGVAR